MFKCAEQSKTPDNAVEWALHPMVTKQLQNKNWVKQRSFIDNSEDMFVLYFFWK